MKSVIVCTHVLLLSIACIFVLGCQNRVIDRVEYPGGEITLFIATASDGPMVPIGYEINRRDKLLFTSSIVFYFPGEYMHDMQFYSIYNDEGNVVGVYDPRLGDSEILFAYDLENGRSYPSYIGQKIPSDILESLRTKRRYRPTNSERSRRMPE